jgi:hypothetical protein
MQQTASEDYETRFNEKACRKKQSAQAIASNPFSHNKTMNLSHPLPLLFISTAHAWGWSGGSGDLWKRWFKKYT